MNKNSEIKDFLDGLCAKTAVLNQVAKSSNGSIAVSVPSKRLNGKSYPIFIIESEGFFVASDMASILTEISKMKDADNRQKIFEFYHQKAQLHGLIIDVNGFVHTQNNKDVSSVINQLLAFETIVYFAFDAAM